MIRFPTVEAEDLRESETRQSLTFAFAFGVFTVILTIAAALFGWLLALPYAEYLTALVFVAGGLYVFLILRRGWLNGREIVSRVVRVAEDWASAEIDVKLAALTPAATPAPAPDRLLPHSVDGRVGELAVDLVDGWLDPRDADWFALYLAKGNPWAERQLKNMPLMHTTDDKGNPLLFGKDRDKPPSPYHKLMVKCVTQEIIGNRGGPGNYTGDLLIADAKEIARRLKTNTPPN